jgi:hypothetical protein
LRLLLVCFRREELPESIRWWRLDTNEGIADCELRIANLSVVSGQFTRTNN